MRRYARFKPGLRQRIESSIASMRAQGIEPPQSFLDRAEAMMPAKRKPRSTLPRADSPHKEPLERDIQKAIVEALELHPRVAKVIRFNQGAAYYRNAQGKEQLVFFSSELVVDLYVMMYEGRYAWLEVKREGWKPHVGPYNPANRTLKREEDQAKFLKAVRNAGGIGAFVRSIDEALEAIA